MIGVSGLTHNVTPSIIREGMWEDLSAGRHLLQEETDSVGKRNAVFARVSTPDQIKDGGSLGHQIQTAIQLAKKQGLPITAVYVDPAKSATRLDFDQRAGVRQLLSDVRNGLVGTLFVYKRDRVARQSGEWFHFLKTCQKHHVEIHFTCPHEPPVGSGIYGKVQEAFMSLWAELEAEQISIRVRDSIMSRFQQGEWIAGVPPFGLTRDEHGHLVKHSTEASLVEEIYRLACYDKLGPVKIARHLNRQHPYSRRGFEWTRDAVAKVLRNRVYCGFISLNVEAKDAESTDHSRLEVRSGKIPMIIPESTWEEAAAIRRSRRCTPGALRPANADTPNLLAGLLECAWCGGPMVARNQSNRYQRQDGGESRYTCQVYYCRNARQGKNCRAIGSVRRWAVEQAVLAAVLPQFGRLLPQELKRLANAHQRELSLQYQRTLQNVKRELGSTNSAIERNRIALERCHRSSETGFYQARITELLTRRDQQVNRTESLQKLLESASKPVNGDSSVASDDELIERFTDTPVELQRLFITEAVQRVVLNPSDRIMTLKLKISHPFIVPIISGDR